MHDMALYSVCARGFFERALLNDTLGDTERTFLHTSLRLMDTFAAASKREGECAVVRDNLSLISFVAALRAAVASEDADLPAVSQQPKKQRRGSARRKSVCGGSVQLALSPPGGSRRSAALDRSGGSFRS